MNNRIIFTLLFVLFLALGTELFALGNKDAAQAGEPLNKEWSLCITAFDTSAMSPAWQTAGDTVARNLAARLRNVDFRLRGEEEFLYYRNYALEKSKVTDAAALVAKRNERDLLIYKGDPSYQYAKALKVVDAAIVTLEEELAEKNAVIPVVEVKPLFKLSEKNISGTFPPPPESGTENLFCIAETADAFLTGSLSEYYGRLFLEIKLYTRYSGSYSYEDSVLFSTEDFDGALNEIGNRLTAQIAGREPSSVFVRAAPSEAMVLIDGAFAGQGGIEAYTRSAGRAEIAVRADNHVPASFPVELSEGELTELYITLTPLGLSAFEANVPDSPGSRVYVGSLFAGETPLALSLPAAGFSHVSVETPEGKVGSAIYRDNSIVRGSAQFRWEDGGGKADFSTVFPVSEETKTVANARNSFYKYYGALWFALPAALLAKGIADSYITANGYLSANPSGISVDIRDRIKDRAALGSVVRAGTYGLIGAALGATFFQIYKYLKASGGDSTPIARAAANTSADISVEAVPAVPGDVSAETAAEIPLEGED